MKISNFQMQYKYQLWLWKQDGVWKRIKHELGIILTIMALTGLLLLIAICN